MKIQTRKLIFTKLIVILAAVLFVFCLLIFSPRSEKVRASASGPSASHTDAPGEDNCTACHGDFAVNSGTGSVTISALPASYLPNQQIPITVTTSQSDATIYGFQLTAIDSQGKKVGTYTLPAQVPAKMQLMDGLVGGNQRQYVEHTVDGIVPTQFGSNSWTFTWNAPNKRAGKVSFYVAGNASNSDGTTAGDYIYTKSKSISGTTVPDFDGDGQSDISIFRPSLGEWWYLKSRDGSNAAFQFGSSTDKLTPGDWTGDGKTDVSFFRPSTGEWFILRSEDFSFFAFPFGTTGDIPAPGDFDGDGKTDAAVFRPADSTWYIRRSSDLGATIVTFGSPGDVPVPADYDGDGKVDIAIYRPSSGQWWLNRSAAGVIAFQFGNSTDKPVQGDYTGDGKADVAFFRPSTGEWFILRSENQSYYAVPFGISTDIPAPGDYDGDGKADQAVFRPSNSVWFIQRSTAGTLIQGFGQSGDLPVSGAHLAP